MQGHGPPGPDYYVTIEARFRVCDDSRGNLIVLVEEQSDTGAPPPTSVSWNRMIQAPARNCQTYHLSWRLSWKFLGIGCYTVRLRVRDSGGLTSEAVQWTSCSYD